MDQFASRIPQNVLTRQHGTLASRTKKGGVGEPSSTESRPRIVIHLDDSGRWTATLQSGGSEMPLGGSYATVTRARFDARRTWGDHQILLVRGPCSLVNSRMP